MGTRVQAGSLGEWASGSAGWTRQEGRPGESGAGAGAGEEGRGGGPSTRAGLCVGAGRRRGRSRGGVVGGLTGLSEGLDFVLKANQGLGGMPW